jgi:rubrerythrin
MSIVESLHRLVDPVAAQNRQEELRAEREQPIREVDGDPPNHTCRVCGYVGPEPSYCPTCLADTMVRVVDAAKGGTRDASSTTDDE